MYACRWIFFCDKAKKRQKVENGRNEVQYSTVRNVLCTFLLLVIPMILITNRLVVAVSDCRQLHLYIAMQKKTGWMPVLWEKETFSSAPNSKDIAIASNVTHNFHSAQVFQKYENDKNTHQNKRHIISVQVCEIMLIKPNSISSPPIQFQCMRTQAKACGNIYLFSIQVRLNSDDFTHLISTEDSRGWLLSTDAMLCCFHYVSDQANCHVCYIHWTDWSYSIHIRTIMRARSAAGHQVHIHHYAPITNYSNLFSHCHWQCEWQLSANSHHFCLMRVCQLLLFSYLSRTSHVCRAASTLYSMPKSSMTIYIVFVCI